MRVPQAFALCLLVAIALPARAEDPALFRRDNLVAWCIVPFDAARRSPEDRAAMLEQLGFTKLAYDWRDEHIPQFDEEVAATRRHGVEIVAWWMAGADLNDTNRKILDVIRRHGLKPQLWTLVGDPDPSLPQEEKVKRCADAIRPLADEAAKLGCQVGLYNHGGWFGEPENQLAILEAIGRENVGLVYNLHHGHAHLDRFPELLARIKPHLLALNLNGMTPRGDEQGKKILPIGTGERDLQLLRVIRDSGYDGPIGILNHTDLDARARLADNLLGLDWLLAQLRGEAAGPLPKMETFAPEAKPAAIELNQSERAAVAELLASAEKGDSARGAALFASHKFACIGCHRLGAEGASIGPELTQVGKDRCPEEIAASLLWPQRFVEPKFAAWALVTDEGNIHQGYIEHESADEVVLREAATGQTLTFAPSSIDERQSIGSLMPEGLAASMTPAERADVMRFLLELGREEAGSALIAQLAAATKFKYDFAPLAPRRWRHALQAVNRERVYDFYAKEAEYFRDLPAVHLLPAFPGLDAGLHGHWGNQNEDTWRDDRWNAMDCGSVINGIVRAGDKQIARGVCVHLGGPEKLSVCFNTETLCYEAAWKGGFVSYSPVRHGFVEGMTPVGEFVTIDGGKTPAKPFRYLGYYRDGDRVAFAYEIAGQTYLDAPTIRDGQFARIVAPSDEHPLAKIRDGGEGRYAQVLETRGTLGSGGAYVVDTINLPNDNPWNALFFFGGHDFLPDGSALACTMHGDVWQVTGLDDTLEQVRWRRFATGLHHPQGLVVADGEIYVLGRNQITRLRDLNRDGEADSYECFSRAFETSTAGHDFICGLERDAAGNFYTVSGNQGLLRISPDGNRAEVLATGFRNPDGLGLAPDGTITVPCSEGEWTPTSMICAVRPDARSSAKPPHYGYGGPRDGQPPALPFVYLPRGLDNSSGGQTYIASERWGPTRGQFVHLSYGAGTYFLALLDEVKGQTQGAVVPMPGDFASGAHRARFHPLDGQLYVTGMGGWGTYTSDDGSFERVRYAGEPVQLPTGFHVHENGIRLSFATPLVSTIASDASRQFAQAWNYCYSDGYGSAELSPSHPGTIGHDRITIASAHVLPDGRSLFLEMPELQPVNQLHLRLQVDGGEAQELFLTVHALDSPFEQIPGYEPRVKHIAPHPQLADLTLLAQPKIPNPWRAPIAGARPIAIEAGKNLTFATKLASAKAGEPVQLSFTNPDVVPHNWVLVKPGALARVGDLVNRLVADPDAARRQYVPVSDDVLHFTDVVPPGETTSIFFTAPSEPGRYPFLCSFPGHWMVMNGVLVVE